MVTPEETHSVYIRMKKTVKNDVEKALPALVSRASFIGMLVELGLQTYVEQERQKKSGRP